jgi:hypothetical protein
LGWWVAAGEKQRTDDLQQLVEQFNRFAQRTAAVIVDSNPPLIAPSSNVGGQAGGEKFVFGGVLFKCAKDWRHLYGSECNAQKAAKLERKALNAVIGLRIAHLHFPLVALVSVHGHLLLCTALIQLGDSNRSLVYGSCDAGCTIRHNPLVEVMMREAATSLHLGEHPVVEGSTGQTRRMCVAVDVEVHYSQADGRFYLLDPARLLPPTLPLRVSGEEAAALGVGNEYLYHHFRPEFMDAWRRHSGAPLSPDAFSPFGRRRSECDEAARAECVCKPMQTLRQPRSICRCWLAIWAVWLPRKY